MKVRLLPAAVTAILSELRLEEPSTLVLKFPEAFVLFVASFGTLPAVVLLVLYPEKPAPVSPMTPTPMAPVVEEVER